MTVVLVGLGALTFWVRRSGRLPGDLTLTLAAQATRSPGLDRLAVGVSAAGSPVGLAVLAGTVVVVLAARRQVREAVLVVATAASAEVGTLLLRVVTQRPRPEAGVVQIVESGPGTSFPSGHAADAAALAIFLGYLVAGWPARNRVAARIGLGLFALAQGATRVYLGAHWTSDVLGGYLLGVSIGLGLGWLSRSHE